VRQGVVVAGRPRSYGTSPAGARRGRGRGDARRRAGPAAVAQPAPSPPGERGVRGAQGSPPVNGASGGLAAARAEAARLQREVARLDTEVEVLAEANAAAQGRLDAVIQEAHRQQAALAGGVAGRVLERDREALAATGLAAGTVRTRVAQLEATQAQAVALRRRLDGQAAEIGGRWWPPPRCAPRGLGSGPSPTRRRRPRRRPRRSGPRWTRSASRTCGARPGPGRSTARGWSAGPTPRPGYRCPAPRGSSSGRPSRGRRPAPR
jgi:hypothetical protein